MTQVRQGGRGPKYERGFGTLFAKYRNGQSEGVSCRQDVHVGVPQDEPEYGESSLEVLESPCVRQELYKKPRDLVGTLLRPPKKVVEQKVQS